MVFWCSFPEAVHSLVLKTAVQNWEGGGGGVLKILERSTYDL